MDQEPGCHARIADERRAHRDSDTNIADGRASAKAQRVLLGANLHHRDLALDHQPATWILAAFHRNSRRRRARRTDCDIFQVTWIIYWRCNFHLRNSLRSPANQRVLPHRRHRVEHSSADHPRQRPWMVALHRFIEVSIGIAVALLITTVWKVPQET